MEVNASIMRNAMRKVEVRSPGFCEPDMSYWVLRYRIAFTFGATELRAFVIWTENGVTCKGPVMMIPISRVL